MPRPPRTFADGGVYHVLNRGNGRAKVFHEDADYLAFVRVLVEGLERYSGIELLSWCLMPNHWHLVLRPGRGAELSELMRWIGVTHVRRHHAQHRTRGGGHLYQGRFRSFPVEEDRHFLLLCRYVEANPLRARLVKRAEEWRWSRLGYRVTEGLFVPIARWPVSRPGGWTRRVNNRVPEAEVSHLRESLKRGAPYGESTWSRRIAAATGLSSKLRPIGRPRKRPVRPVGQGRRRNAK